jgi:hypothetical protein
VYAQVTYLLLELLALELLLESGSLLELPVLLSEESLLLPLELGSLLELPLELPPGVYCEPPVDELLLRPK